MGRVRISGSAISSLSSSSFALLALLAFFMMLSLVPGHGHAATTEKRMQPRPWPCCNSCGGCTKSIPPRCQCQDLVRSCHPMCQKCVKSPLSADPPLYQCMDLIPNFCKYNCRSRLHSTRPDSDSDSKPE